MSLEKNKLQSSLVEAFDQFIEVLASIEEQRINQQPFAGSWTPAQVARHIILATDGLPDKKTKPLDREVDALLPSIRPWWENLNQKFKSPQPLLPEEKPHSKSELLSSLRRIRDKDLAIAAQQDLTPICLDIDLPTIGYLTRYEWLWFIEMHLRRHIFQLQNMKSILDKR